MLSGCEHDPHATSCTMCGHWFEESQIACSVVTCIKVHLEFQDPLNFTFCRQLREKEDLNIAAVFATSLSFVVAFLAANRKWERYKMDNYEDHYDMSCPSTIVSHCLSNRENEIPIETSRNDSKGTASSFHESWVGDFHLQSVIGTQHKLIGSPTCRWVVVLLCSAIDRYRLCSNKSKGMRDSV